MSPRAPFLGSGAAGASVYTEPSGHWNQREWSQRSGNLHLPELPQNPPLALTGVKMRRGKEGNRRTPGWERGPEQGAGKQKTVTHNHLSHPANPQNTMGSLQTKNRREIPGVGFRGTAAAPAEPPARWPHLPAILEWTWARRRSGRAQGGAAGASCRRVSPETPPGEGAAAAGGRAAPQRPRGTTASGGRGRGFRRPPKMAARPRSLRRSAVCG